MKKRNIFITGLLVALLTVSSCDLISGTRSSLISNSSETSIEPSESSSSSEEKKDPGITPVFESISLAEENPFVHGPYSYIPNGPYADSNSTLIEESYNTSVVTRDSKKEKNDKDNHPSSSSEEPTPPIESSEPLSSIESSEESPIESSESSFESSSEEFSSSEVSESSSQESTSSQEEKEEEHPEDPEWNRRHDNGIDLPEGNNNGNKGDRGKHNGKDKDKDGEIDPDEEGKPIEDVVLPSIEVDKSTDEIVTYVGTNETAYITISLVNPDSLSILSFTLNGNVYQSYQFAEGSTSQLLVLPVQTGNVPGIKEFTLDGMKFVNANNQIDDVIIEGDRTVKMAIAYDNIPEAVVSYESIDTTSYEAEIIVYDPNSLINFENEDCKIYLYDGYEVIEEIPLQKGANIVKFENLYYGTEYSYIVTAIYNNLDELGTSAHSLLRRTFCSSNLVKITDLTTNKNYIEFHYVALNKDAQFVGTYLLDNEGNAVAMSDDPLFNKFEHLYSNYEYELRVYFKLIVGEEEWIVYDSFAAKTKSSYVPNIGARFTVDITTATFDVTIDDEDNVADVRTAKLYDANNDYILGIDLHETGYEGILLENLAPNAYYYLRIGYVYDLNDGKGEQVGEKVVTFTTSKLIPTITLEQYAATENTIKYNLIVNDPNVVGTLSSLRLYNEHHSLIKDIKDIATMYSGTLTGLSANTNYILEAGITYDMNDGKGSKTATYSTEVHTAKRIPTYGVSAVEATKDSITFKTDRFDFDNAGRFTSIYVYDQRGEEIASYLEDEIQELTTITGLNSDSEYYVSASYVYDLNNYEYEVASSASCTIRTVQKEVPTVNVILKDVDFSSASYKIDVADPDNLAVIDKVTLYQGSTIIAEDEEMSELLFDNLWSNTAYTIEVSYHYDLNNGFDVVEETTSKQFTTNKHDNVNLEYTSLFASDTSIEFNFDVVDSEGLLVIDKFEIYTGEDTLVQTIEDPTCRSFENLERATFYTIRTYYHYDLNDGTGVHEDVAAIQYGTKGAQVFVTGMEVINKNTPSVGDLIQLRVYLDNPDHVNVTGLYVDNQQVQVLSGSLNESGTVIVGFVPDTEGGFVNVNITGYRYEAGNGIYLDEKLVNQFSDDIVVLGNIRVIDYFAISDTMYEIYSRYGSRILEIDNPGDYEIYSLTIGDSWSSWSSTIDSSYIKKLDNSHFLITCADEGLNLVGITYGLNGYTKEHTFTKLSCNYNRIENEIHIKTVEDILALEGIYGSYYYILDNDIDMINTPCGGLNFNGVFNGNNHTISNVTIVDENHDSTADKTYAFLNCNIVYDLNLENVYYYVENDGHTRLSGITTGKAYNCYISGDIYLDGPGVVYGIAMNGAFGCVANNLRIVSNNPESYLVSNYYNGPEDFSNIVMGNSYIMNFDHSNVRYTFEPEIYSARSRVVSLIGKTLTDRQYTIVTNSSQDNIVVNGIYLSNFEGSRPGYKYEIYDNPEFSGLPISLPYYSDDVTTLYLKWIKTSEADKLAKYRYELNYNGSVSGYVITSFGDISEKSELVIGGYYKGLPVVGVDYAALNELVQYKIDNLGVSYTDYVTTHMSVYILDTIYYIPSYDYFRGDVFIEKGFDGLNSLLNYSQAKVYMSENTYQLALNAGYINKWMSNPYTKCNQSVFEDVKTNIESEEVELKLLYRDAENIKKGIKFVPDEFNYTIVDTEDARYIYYNDYQFVVIDGVVFTNVLAVDHDDYFKYIVYSDGTVAAVSLINKEITEIDFTSPDLKYEVTQLADNLFYNVKSLEKVVFSDSITSIGSTCFYNTYIIEANLPKNLTYLGAGAFNNCKKLVSVTFGNLITEISPNTFNECNALSSVALPNGIKKIGSYAFCYCYSLSSINFPTSLEQIDANAFYYGGSNNNFNFIIPSSVVKVGERAFAGSVTILLKENVNTTRWARDWHTEDCNVYENFISVDSDEWFEYIVFADRVVANKLLNKKITSIDFSSSSFKYTINELANSLFQNVKIYNVVFGNNIKSIGNYAFANTYLEGELIIPDTVTYIGSSAFSNTNITSVNLGKAITRLQDSTFYNCRKLTSISIPDNIIEIGTNCFNNCNNVTSVKLGKGLRVIGYHSFASLGNVDIIEIPGAVNIINEYAFAYNYGTTILLSSDVSSIKHNAFNYTKLVALTGEEPISWEANWRGDEKGETIYNVSKFDQTDFWKYILYKDGTIGIIGLVDNSISKITLDDYDELAMIGNVVSVWDIFSNCDRLKYVEFPNTVKEIYSTRDSIIYLLPESVEIFSMFDGQHNDQLTNSFVFTSKGDLNSDLFKPLSDSAKSYVFTNFDKIETRNGMTYAICNNNEIYILDYDMDQITETISFEIEGYKTIGLGSKLIYDIPQRLCILIPATVTHGLYNAFYNLNAEFHFAAKERPERVDSFFVNGGWINYNSKGSFTNDLWSYSIDGDNNVIILECLDKKITVIDDSSFECFKDIGKVIAISSSFLNGCNNIKYVIYPDTVERIEGEMYIGENRFTVLPTSLKECGTMLNDQYVKDNLIFVRGTNLNGNFFKNLGEELIEHIHTGFIRVESNGVYTYAVCENNEVYVLKLNKANSVKVLDFNIPNYKVIGLGRNLTEGDDYATEKVIIPDTVTYICTEAFTNLFSCKEIFLSENIDFLGNNFSNVWASIYSPTLDFKDNWSHCSGSQSSFIFDCKGVFENDLWKYKLTGDGKVVITSYKDPNKTSFTLGDFDFFKTIGQIKGFESEFFTYSNLLESIELPDGVEFVHGSPSSAFFKFMILPSSVTNIDGLSISRFGVVVSRSSEAPASWYTNDNAAKVINEILFGFTGLGENDDYKFLKFVGDRVVVYETKRDFVVNTYTPHIDGFTLIGFTTNSMVNKFGFETLILSEEIEFVKERAFSGLGCSQVFVRCSNAKLESTIFDSCPANYYYAPASKPTNWSDGLTNHSWNIVWDAYGFGSTKNWEYRMSSSGELTLTRYKLLNDTAITPDDFKELEGVGLVTGIYGSAFNDMYSLQSIELIDSIKYLYSSFPGYSSLKYVVLPSCLELISDTLNSSWTLFFSKANNAPSSFNARSASNIIFGFKEVKSNEVYEFAVCGENDAYILGTSKPYTSKVLDLSIPGYTVKGVGSYSFRDLTNTQNLIIPSSISYLGSDAFSYCYFTTIEIMEGASGFKENAFSYCTGEIFVRDNEISPSWSLQWYKGSNNITFGISSKGETDKIYYIVDNTGNVIVTGFKNTSVVILSSSDFYISEELAVTSFASGLFENCTSLVSLEIPSSVTSINTPLYGNKINTVIIGDNIVSLNVSYLSDNVSYYTHLDKDTAINKWGESVANRLIFNFIGFGENEQFTYAILANNEARITGLNDVYMKQTLDLTIQGFTVTSICPRLFEANRFLKTIFVPDSVKEIGYQAFYDCSNVSIVYIPSTVDFIGDNAFPTSEKTTLLFEVNEAKENWRLNIANVDNLVLWGISKDMIKSSSIYDYVVKDGEISLINFKGSKLSQATFDFGDEGKVVNIANQCFYSINTYDVNGIIIPEGVKYIGRNAFTNCTYNISYIYVPSSVTYFGDRPFSWSDEASYAFIFYSLSYKDMLTRFGSSLRGQDSYSFYGIKEIIVGEDYTYALNGKDQAYILSVNKYHEIETFNVGYEVIFIAKELYKNKDYSFRPNCIIIPDSVQILAKNPFEWNSYTLVYISENVMTCYSETFNNSTTVYVGGNPNDGWEAGWASSNCTIFYNALVSLRDGHIYITIEGVENLVY